MSRGKHASSVAVRKVHALEDEVQDLRAQLLAERRARSEDKLRHARERADHEKRVATETAEHVQRLLTERAATLGNGLAATAWKAQRLMMTRHLARLFFSGLLSWDRLKGDVEVLTFIAAHGDIDAWFTLTSQYGWRVNRAGVREAEKRARRGEGIFSLLAIEKSVRGALDTTDSAWERLRQEREELDRIVEAARDAFINVELTEEINEVGAFVAEATPEQVAIHQEIMRSIDDYLKADGRATT